MLERWEEELVAVVVNELVDSFIERGRSDLVREVTFNFPVQVIARILGLPRADYPRFQRWALELTSVSANWERGLAASAALRDYFVEVMAERRARARRRPHQRSGAGRGRRGAPRATRRSTRSCASCCRPVSRRPTARRAASCSACSTTGDQLDALYGDRSLYAQAFEEVLRWEPPVTLILRRATRDSRAGRRADRRGSRRRADDRCRQPDERKYADPDRYDMFRDQRQHVGFGFGVHVCLGMHLARMESRVAINTLFDRLGPITLDPAAEPPHIEGLAFRSPLSLPVVFAAS